MSTTSCRNVNDISKSVRVISNRITPAKAATQKAQNFLLLYLTTLNTVGIPTAFLKKFDKKFAVKQEDTEGRQVQRYRQQDPVTRHTPTGQRSIQCVSRVDL
eukprot:3293688-Pyramimonas_sp.AAC.1